MKILGLIPARGGSRELPNKNAKLLHGRSLVERAFDCGREAGVLDRIILSTDDAALRDSSRAHGLDAPFLRPAEFARDDSPMIDVAVHALEALAKDGDEFDAVLLLQPTSPLRRPEHIREAVELLGDYDSVCTVIPVPQGYCPHYLMKITEDGYLDYFLPEGAKITRRQDVPPAWKREGTIFLTRTPVLLEERSFYGRRCRPLVMDPDDSLNIDTPEDWDEALRRLSEIEA
jgi:CMP-N-acetylneuraminic acid synthetase